MRVVMRRSVWVSVAAACVISGAAVGFAVAEAGPATQVRSSPELRVVHNYRNGPNESCDGDSCGVFTIDPIRFTLPGDHASYSGTIALSFGYVTVGDARFQVDATVRTAAGKTVGDLAPAFRTVSPVRYRDSRTLLFTVTGLPGGTALQVTPVAGMSYRTDQRNIISTKNMLVEIRVSADDG